MAENTSWRSSEQGVGFSDHSIGPWVHPADVILALMALAAAFFAVSGAG
jgi:hypothetical protein